MEMRTDGGIWLLIASALPVSISVGIRAVILMPYLAMLGFTEAQMGLIAMANSLFMALITIPTGILSDIKGRKTILLASRLLVALSDLMFFTLVNLPGLVIASAIGGAGASMTTAVRLPFLADKARGDELRREAITYSFAFFHTGSVLGYVLAGLPDLLVAHGMAPSEATRSLFAICSASALTSLILVIPVAEERRPPVRASMAVRSWRVIGSFCAFQAVLSYGFGMVTPWFSYYFFTRFGIRFSRLGLLFALKGVFAAVGSLSASKVASRLGEVKTAISCQLASTGALLAIPLSTDFTIASAFYVVMATLMNMAMPVLRAIYMGLLRRDERALGNAIDMTVFWASASAGSYSSGLLIEAVSLDAPFLACPAVYLVAMATLWAFFGRGGVTLSGKDLKPTPGAWGSEEGVARPEEDLRESA